MFELVARIAKVIGQFFGGGRGGSGGKEFVGLIYFFGWSLVCIPWMLKSIMVNKMAGNQTCTFDELRFT